MSPKRASNSAPLQGLVFDFDGTILDTETPVYESWAETFLIAGAEPISRQRWLQDIGKADDFSLDVRAELCGQLGVDGLSAQVEEMRLRFRDEMLSAQQVRPGVTDWINAAAQAGLPLAVASSSPTSWVSAHLERLGLASFFSTLSCADPGIPGKPDPTVYLSACQTLGIKPKHALAIEDSPHGVSAAITAGMQCIATPGPMTRDLDFAHATCRVDQLDEIDPADWFTN